MRLLVLLAQAAAQSGDLPSVGFTGLGVAGVCVALAVAGWRAARADGAQEKARADHAQQQLLEVTRQAIQTNTETVSALRGSTQATEALTAEVRRLGERR